MTTQFSKIASALAFTIAAAVPLSSSAAVLTFDDVPSTNGVIPNGYGGLNWDNMNFVDTSGPDYANSGYRRGLVSGNFVAYNNGGMTADTLSVSSATTFDFNSAFLTAAWNKDLSIDVEGYRNGELLYTKTVVVSDLAPTAFKFEFNGIDDLRFISYGGVNAGGGGEGHQFALDNFAYNESAQVPEPATLSLLGLGLIGLAARRKARQDKHA